MSSAILEKFPYTMIFWVFLEGLGTQNPIVVGGPGVMMGAFLLSSS